MTEIPEPGTWVRLTRASLPAGRWHHVVGWHPRDERLQLVCANRDRNISWALDDLGEWAVARSSRRPDDDVCGTCRRREQRAMRMPLLPMPV